MQGGDTTIAGAVKSGLTSEAFDLSANVSRGDERHVDPALFAMEAIMTRDGCDFDTARMLYNREKMAEAGIDPDTGLSLDPKAVTSTEDFERVLTDVTAVDPLVQACSCDRVADKAARTKQWWLTQVEIFGLGFVVFISLSNFLFGVLTEWYAIFLSYYLKDDLHMDPSTAQAVSATAGLALQLRPLCGSISDSYPLFGSSRHSWWFASAMLAVFSQALLLMVTDVTLTTILLFLINFFGGTWVFVISGAMIAEASRKDPKAGAESLQAIQWGFYALGSLSGDFSAGPIYMAICEARLCFALSMVLYFLLAFAPFSVVDHSASAGSPMARLQRLVDSYARSCCATCCRRNRRNKVGDVGQLSMESALSAAAQSVDNSEGNVTVVDEAARKPPQGSLLTQMRRIWRTVDPRGPTKGLLLRPALYIIFCCAVVPDYYYGATYYFYTAAKVQEVNGCNGSLSTQISCMSAPSVQIPRRPAGGCAAVAAEGILFTDDVLKHFQPMGSSMGVLRWEYSGGGPGECAACGDLMPDGQHPSLERLCADTSDCEMRISYEGTGCSHDSAWEGTELGETSSEIATAGNAAGCVETRTCVRSVPNACPTDEILETQALQHSLGVTTGVAAPAATTVISSWLTSLQPICNQGSWLPGCENGTAVASEDAGGYGYGYGYGYGDADSSGGGCAYVDASAGYGYGGAEVCAPIETVQYFAVLTDQDPELHHDNAACDLAICNVTTTDACTAFQGGLAFDPSYYSFLQGVASIGSLIGTFVYGGYLSGVSLRKSLAGVHIALAVVGGFDAMLALRLNLDWGISDTYFAGIDQFGYWFCYQCKLLPMYALATRICPPGLEATMIAVVLSLKDIGFTIASYYGAFLTLFVGIKENECGVTPFTSLYILYLWRIVCRLLPAIFVMLIPTNQQINDAMEALAEGERLQSRSSAVEEGLGSSLTSGSEQAAETTANPTAMMTSEPPKENKLS